MLCKRADLLLVTDGHAKCNADVQEQLAQAREQQGLRVFGLTVGGGSLGHAVSQLCDSTVDLDNAIATDDAEAVASVSLTPRAPCPRPVAPLARARALQNLAPWRPWQPPGRRWAPAAPRCATPWAVALASPAASWTSWCA